MADSKTKPFMQSTFFICVTLLLAACLGKKAVINWTGVVLTKIPIDLRKSFDEIDKEQLSPYKVIDEKKITNKDVLEALGTNDYIQWILEDPEVNEKSPVRFCSLFITYYGKPDRVPHVPEECYVGAGNEQLGRKSVELKIDGKEDPLDIRLLVFGSGNADIWSSGSKFSRMYFFKVNYDYANGRTEVRESLVKNLFGKHSFFSKVEWEFFGTGFSGRSRPSDEQNIAASEKLMSKLLPVLENEHWPDIDGTDGDEVSETKLKELSEAETTPAGLKN